MRCSMVIVNVRVEAAAAAVGSGTCNIVAQNQLCTTSSGAIDTRDQSLVDSRARARERTIFGDTKTTTTADKKGPSQGSNTPAIRKRIGTITIVFVTLLLGSSRRKAKIVETRSAPATEEDVKSTGNVVVVGQTRIVPSTTAAAAAGSIRTTCSSTASPSPSKRKFQFQNNRTSPYEPQEVRHVQHLQLSGKDQDIEPHHAAESPADPLTVHNGVSADGPALKRPVELLHRRKIYVEGPRQLVGSSSSELSTAAATNVNYRNRERQNGGGDTASNNGVALVEQQQQSNNSRQISPASCNSESVASSNVGTGSCGLCGLMPHCATLEGSAKARKIRDHNTVIVEEEAALPKVADRESGGGAVTVPSSRTQQQQQVGRGSHGQNRTAAGAGESGSATTVGGKSHRMSKFNSSSMDRSVDSIGSCSLDVDADSTDFSDTSGSFNLLTPSSAKDFPREFITRIHERCQIQPVAGIFTQQNQQLLRQQLHHQHQQTSIVLDPQSGRVNTVLAVTAATPGVALESLAVAGGADESCGEPKKPSYLNLACCVNGYSNLTTYDSKFRQNINKSREVSPIRPITTTSQPTVTSASGHLGVPNYSHYPTSTNATTTTSQPMASNGNGFVMDQQHQQQRSVMSPEKRLFTAHIMQSATLNSSSTHRANGHSDVPDNANGVEGVFRTTKYLQQKYAKSESLVKNGNGTVTTITSEVTTSPTNGSPCKSFIEQRVERLYGPGALAQGFHANRRSMEKSVLAERNIYSNAQSKGSGTPLKPTNGNGLYTPKRVTGEHQHAAHVNGENAKEVAEDTIPVLRHLRPEFRAQLPISSPKRSPPKESNGGSNNNGSMAVDAELILSQPIKLQFQTVSISKLQQTTVVNGASAKSITAETSDADRGERTVVVQQQQTTKQATNTKPQTTTTRNAETIDNNNRGEAAVVGCVDVVGQGDNVKISRHQTTIEATNGGGGATNTIELEATTHAVEQVEIKMPTKQEVAVPVDDKENAMVKGACGGKAAATEKDGNYFLGVMNGERNRILALADHCDTYLDAVTDQEDSEELVGIIRAASGKARLLSSQKMNQFQGLCHNQLHQAADEKFPTTAQDLQGFWDMLMLQVNHVDKLFEEIEELKRNDWKKCADSTDSLPPPQGAKLVKRPGTKAAKSSSTSTSSAAATAAAQKREAARKQLMELKRKNKQAMSAAGGDSPAVVE